ncbi:MAG: hypothetical protein V1799_06890 [bacterium]
MEAQKNQLLNLSIEVLNFLKSKYHIYHQSNIFFRDVQYGVMAYLHLKKYKCSYGQAEELALIYLEFLEKKEIVKKMDSSTWLVNYPDFKKPIMKPVAPAKPAATTATVKVSSPVSEAPAQQNSVPSA